MSVTVRNQSKVVNDGQVSKTHGRNINNFLNQVRQDPIKPISKTYIKAPEFIPRTSISVSLPDSVMIRLLEVVVEELVVNDYIRQQELHPLTKWSRLMPLYRDYLYQFLLQQYGRNNLSYAYMREIENRLLYYTKDANNEYAGTLLDMVQQKFIDPQNANIAPFTNMGQGGFSQMKEDNLSGEIRVNLSSCKTQILNLNTQRTIVYSIKVF